MENFKKIRKIINKYIVPSFSVILMTSILYVSINRIQKPIIIDKEQAAETIKGSSLSFSPTTLSTIPGDAFDVQLIINTNTETISAVDLFLIYDKNVLRANSVKIGNFLPKLLSPVNVNNQIINIILGCEPNFPKAGTGVLATINFTAISVGNTSISYTSNSQITALSQDTNSLTSSSTSVVTVSLPPTPIPPTFTPTQLPTNTPTPTLSYPEKSKISIYALGTQAGSQYPTMTLLINNETKTIFYNVVNTIRTFTYESPIKINPSQVKIAFINDYYNTRMKEDRNLRVDKIIIDNITYQSEDFYSTGTHNKYSGCKSGYKNSDWLHCNGYFDFSMPKPN
jgi:hypothetical protein